MKIRNAWRKVNALLQSKKIITAPLSAIEGDNAVIFLDDKDHDEVSIKITIPLEEMCLSRNERNILRRMVGVEIDFIIESANKKDGTAIGSRKKAMEIKKELYFNKHKEGDIILARITGIGTSSVRAEACGVETIVPINEVDWGYINNLRECVSVGEKKEAKIIAIDHEAGTIQLSFKQAKKNPFFDAPKRFTPYSEHEGVIRNVRDGGVFVELAKGINTRCNFPKWDNFDPTPGDKVVVRIKKVDMEKQRITCNLIRINKKAN